jgi:hypothetical protein
MFVLPSNLAVPVDRGQIRRSPVRSGTTARTQFDRHAASRRGISTRSGKRRRLGSIEAGQAGRLPLAFQPQTWKAKGQLLSEALLQLAPQQIPQRRNLRLFLHGNPGNTRQDFMAFVWYNFSGFLGQSVAATVKIRMV